MSPRVRLLQGRSEFDYIHRVDEGAGQVRIGIFEGEQPEPSPRHVDARSGSSVMCTAWICVVPATNGFSVNWHAPTREHAPFTQLSVAEQQRLPHTCCAEQQMPATQANPVGQHGSLPQGDAPEGQS